MTKLLEFIAVFVVFFSVWFSVISVKSESKVYNEWRNSVLFLPVYLVILFGMYSVYIVLLRVFTLKDCDEAAKELQEEIQQAKADLRSKGLDL